MKKRVDSVLVLGLFAAFIFCCTEVSAKEQYQAEVSAEYFRGDSDNNFRDITAGVIAEVFFAPVNTADHPYAEVAFLERIGSVFFTAAQVDTKGEILIGDGMLYAAGVNYTKPDFPLAITATYATSKLDFNGPVAGDGKISEYSLAIGNYFTRALLAGVEYSYTKSDASLAGFTDISNKTTEYGLFAKYIHELYNGKWLGFGGALGTSKVDDGTETLTNTEVSLSVDYFFNRRLSAGVAVENSSGKDTFSEGMTYSVNVNAFITPRFSIRAAYERFLNSNDDEPSDRSVDVALAARF